MKPYEPEKPRSAFEDFYASIGKQSSRALFEQMKQAKSVKSDLTYTKALASLVASAVHAITLAFMILGVGLLIGGWPNFMAAFGGIFCLGCAWFVRPHLPKLPEEIIDRDRCPTLYNVVDRVAQALGTSSIHGIVLNWDFNAAFAQAGWRRKKILYLGLPLISILDGQEQVALIGHELAHGVNRDPMRGLIVGTAIHSLSRWYAILRPHSLWSQEHGFENIFIVPFNAILLAIAQVVYLGIYVLSHLLWRDSQRAEYLADYLATHVAGTAAMLSMLDKLHLGSALSLTIERMQRQTRNRRESLAALRAQVAGLPQRELERVRRTEHLQASRLDRTHPPTLYRIEFLKAHYISEGQIRLSGPEVEQVAHELGLT